MLKTILLINPVYVTLFWAIVLNTYSFRKHNPKNFLGKFMIVAFVVYLSHFFYFSGLFEYYRFVDSLYIWAFLLVYPLYHIYIRLLTVEKRFSFKKHGRFLALPTFIFVVYLIGVLVITKDEHLYYLIEILPGTGSHSGMQSFLFLVFNLARVVFILQVFYYLFMNFRLIIQNSKSLEDYYSDTEGRELVWVQVFNISLAVTSVASILVAVIGRDAFAESAYLLIAPSLIFSTMLFLIGLIGNKQNPAYIEDLEHENEGESNINFNYTSLKKRLDVLFEKDEIYKTPDLKIWDIAEKLGSNRTYVSKLINVEYKRNFCNHVNYYRVKHAKQLIKDNPGLSNQLVADLSGFGSVKSLHRAFNTIGETPLNNLRKEIQSK